MKSDFIENVYAREVLDSRGNPTIEVEVWTTNGGHGRSIVPSGASTGKNEAHELRDNEKKRFGGKGVQQAVKNVNEIIKPKIVGMNVFKQSKIDAYLNFADGTLNKSSLGANAILGVSMAVCRAAADSINIPLYRYIGGIRASSVPIPMMNILNGGKHADNNLNIQEFMIVPDGANSFEEGLRMCAEVYWTLKGLLKDKGLTTSVGDEGGFAPNLKNDIEAIKIILKAIEKAGYKDSFKIALDVAASEMYDKGVYKFWKTGEEYTTDELIDYYQKLIMKYPIISIEDGLSEEDWVGWEKLTNELSDKVYLVGDDLFTTNEERLFYGIQNIAANSILIKPNQIGTVTETMNTVKLANLNGYMPIISHRSGETEDTFIADFAVRIKL